MRPKFWARVASDSQARTSDITFHFDQHHWQSLRAIIKRAHNGRIMVERYEKCANSLRAGGAHNDLSCRVIIELARVTIGTGVII